jgi:hypothetical protein
MCKKFICLTLFFAFCSTAVASDIAISTQAGWFAQGVADTEMQKIVNNVKGVSIQVFTSGQQSALADWVKDHTGDGTSDLLILCGQFPNTIYAPGNTQADNSLAELFLDDGNTIINTGDYMFYVVDGAGTNAAGGLQTMMDIGGITMWDRTAPVTPTTEGKLYTPSFQGFAVTRPWHLDELTNNWEAELILGIDAAGTSADPAIIVNTVTHGRLGTFYQIADDSPPRGQVISEWINNYWIKYIAAGNPYAKSPNPKDGATGVVSPLVQWKAGDTGAFHDVYFGTNPTPGPAEFRGRQQYLVYWHGAGITPGTTYYWRIDEVEADGVTIHTGNVWSFTAAPLNAYAPIPADGAKWVDLEADLSWTAGATGIKHDVYFGTDQTAVANGTGGTLKSSQQPAKTYEPGTLALDTTYYWKVDEYNSGGTKFPGTVWSFATLSANAGIRGQYFSNMNLTGAPALVRIDPTINFNWGDGTPGAPIPVDLFSARWVGVVEAQYSEPYTFTTNSDDGIRVWLNDVLIIDSWIDQGPTMHPSPAINLVAGQRYGIRVEYYENGGGAVAQLYWQSPSTPNQIVPAGALQLPLAAGNPIPPNGAVDVKQTPTLRWSVGEKAVKHNVYFGTDANAVLNATTASTSIYRGQQNLAANSYVPTEAPLAWNSTYYWRIDEVNAADTWRGNVWSFTTANSLVVDDFEDYTDDVGSRIFQTWKDGWGYSEPAPGYPGNGTGSTVGYAQPPFAEPSIVHGGNQSMPLGYDNSGTGGKARYSETFREWTTPQDWTVNNCKVLTLYVQGIPLDFLESPAGTYTMAAEGSDIWGTADEFRYMYKQLSGDGEIVARVDRIAGPGTNTWAKAGVMIRETIAAGSTHAFCCITPGNGKSFQNRTVADSTSYNSNTGGYVAPYWVKLVRQGNQFTGYHSFNGVDWVLQPVSGETPNPQTINMATNVLIGLAFTSHENDVLRVAQFSNVSTSPSVTGTWTVADISETVTGTNDDEPLYVAVEDNAGHIKVVPNANPLASVDPDWQEWNILLSDFSGAGVNLKAVKKMYIGLGNRASPTVGGTGKIYVDDIAVYPSRCVPSMSKPTADIAEPYDCKVGNEDLNLLANEWLSKILSQNWQERAAYWDSRYRTSWASEADSIAVRDGLAAAGYTILNADQLKTWMNARIADKKLSVVVFCRDNAPDTVVESVDPNCTLRKYLDAGGKIVFYADIPFWDIAHADTTWDNPQGSGQANILGIGNVDRWDSGEIVTITDTGAHWGLTQTWASARANDPTGLTVLAMDSQGYAAAWVKHYLPGDSARGFVRLWDRGGRPIVADIIRAAESKGYLVADLYKDDTVDFKDFAVLVDSWLEEKLWP